MSTLLEDPTREAAAEPLPRGVARVLVLGGTVGLVAAFDLAVERVRLLQDPSYSPSCDLSPVLSCGSVMVTDQASVLGFPNPFLGVAAFSVVVTVGVVALTGAALPRWFLGGLLAGTLAGVAFVHWLAFESLYRIGALCPWCMVVWVATLALATWTGLHVLRTGAEGSRRRRVGEALWHWRWTLLTAWLLVFAVAILVRFWDYWSTLP